MSWLFPETVSGWFAKSLADLLWHDGQTSRYVTQPDAGFISLSSGPRVAEARCQIVDVFAESHPKAEWLLMLDSDMAFKPDLLDQLMAVADPEKVPIVGGLCFAGGKSQGPYPTVYRAVQRGEEGSQYASIERVYDYPRDALVRVAATGGACLLMHRGALAAIGNHYGVDPDGKPNPYPWFSEGVRGPAGEPWGEDVIFCLRAFALGIPVHVHTGVKLGHAKVHLIDETFYDNYRRSIELTAQGAYDKPASNGHQPNRAQRRAAARKGVKVA